MGLEHLDLYIVAFLTNLLATLVGAFYIAFAGLRPLLISKANATKRTHFSLLAFTAAVATPPIIVGAFYALPYSLKDRYIFGMPIGVLDLLTCSSMTVLLLIATLVLVSRDSGTSRGTIKYGTMVLLIIYACGLGVLVKFAGVNEFLCNPTVMRQLQPN